MLCWPGWLLVGAVVAAAIIGFVLCFLWHWWLISRPGSMDRRTK